MSQPTTLYRFFDADGQLLYVGISARGAARWSEHAGDKPWWPKVAQTTTEHFASRPEAAAAETEAIRTERPRHNVVGSTSRKRRSSLTLDDEQALASIRTRRASLLADEIVAVKQASANGASSYAIGAALGRSHVHAQRLIAGTYDKRLNAESAGRLFV